MWQRYGGSLTHNDMALQEGLWNLLDRSEPDIPYLLITLPLALLLPPIGILVAGIWRRDR